MGRNQDHTDGGIASFFEARANGLNAATLHAPAVLAATYDLELFDALPGATEFVQIDATGKLFTAVGASGTLDEAYDSGGAGAGRIITADSGPVEAAGAGGFLASHSAPVYGLETTGAEFNFRLTAGQTTDILEIQRGDQDSDISDDTFDALFALDGLNRRMGINTVAPATLMHLLSPSGDAKLTIEAPALSDPSVVFNENATARWEVGYDQSAGAFVVGRLNFTIPVVFIEDGTSDVGIGSVDPDARLHVASGASLVAVFESSVPIARIGLQDTASSDENQVGVQAAGDDLQLFAGATAVVLVTASGVTIDQDTNNPSLTIDSLATSNPLLALLPVTGNSRGDIAFGTARTANPSTPVEGDFWYTAGAEALGVRHSSAVRLLGGKFSALNLGFPALQALTTIGNISLNSGNQEVSANSGTVDDFDGILSASKVDGDVVYIHATALHTITARHNSASGGASPLKLSGGASQTIFENATLVLRYDATGDDWIQISPILIVPL